MEYAVSARVPVVGSVYLNFDIESEKTGADLTKFLTQLAVEAANGFLFALEAARSRVDLELDGGTVRTDVETWDVQAMREIVRENFFFGEINEVSLDIENFSEEDN